MFVLVCVLGPLLIRTVHAQVQVNFRSVSTLYFANKAARQIRKANMLTREVTREVALTPWSLTLPFNLEVRCVPEKNGPPPKNK